MVGAVVVDDQDFPGEVCGGLGIKGVEKGGEIVGSVVGANGDGELGGGHSSNR